VQPLNQHISLLAKLNGAQTGKSMKNAFYILWYLLTPNNEKNQVHAPAIVE